MKYIVSIDNGDMLKVVKLVNDATFTKTIEQDSDEVFFREKLDSPIRLKGADYDFVYDRFFPSHLEEKMLVNIKQVYSAGGIEKEIDYYNGYFTRVDCEFDNDNKVVEINVTTDDIYEDLLAGVDDEYDIIKMDIPTAKMQYKIRPIIQVYRQGDNKLTNFVGGTYWEEDCISDISQIDLINVYGFTLNSYLCKISVGANPNIPQELIGDYICNFGSVEIRTYQTTNGFGLTDYHTIKTLNGEGLNKYGHIVDVNWTYHKIISTQPSPPAVTTITGEVTSTLRYVNGQQSAIYSFNTYYNVTAEPTYNWTYIQTSPLGYGTILFTSLALSNIYSRAIMGKLMQGAFPRRTSDITEYNTSYRYVKGIDAEIISTYQESIEATKWGKNDNGNYFMEPNTLIKHYPISRSTWENYSLWFRFNSSLISELENGSRDIILKDAYTIEATIQALLNKILGEGVVKFEGTTDYSEFFYSTASTPFRPLQKDLFYPLITPKSNILKGEYDKPAQKGAITLKEVFDMLRNVFNCYWRLDNVGGEIRLRIEHIHYFENGGSYSDINTIGIDLTNERDVKSKRYYAIAIANYISGKHFPINSNKWKYNKKDLPTRIEYAFMDNCSEAFNGYPIIVNSPNVTKGKIDKIQSAKFTPDIDMMVSTPEEFNNDGFALLGATKIISRDFEYILPIINININNMNLFLQNGYLAYVKLHADYFKYNCPATNVTINETETQAISIIKTKEQEVEFPNQEDIDYKKNIKSGLGVGTISKINVNLSNRKNIVTLKFND